MSTSADLTTLEQVDTHNLAHFHLHIGDQVKVLYFDPDRLGPVGGHMIDAGGKRESVVVFVGLGAIVWVTGPSDQTELAIYRSLNKDAHGSWFLPDGQGRFKKGTELSTRKGGRSAGNGWGDGRLKIVKATAADGSDYAGTLKVVLRPIMPVGGWQAVNMEWDLADGKFATFGLQRHGTIFAAYSIADDKSLPYGVGVVSGQTAEGAYLASGQIRPLLVKMAPHDHD